MTNMAKKGQTVDVPQRGAPGPKNTKHRAAGHDEVKPTPKPKKSSFPSTAHLLLNFVFWPFTYAFYKIRIVAVIIGPFLIVFYNAIVACVLFYKFVKSPGAFFRRGDHPSPPCLSDQRYGSHHYIKLKKGLKLHYITAGSPAQPLMLFVHGFPEFWYSWRHQIDTFKTQYRVVAMDMRGYGDSDIMPSVSDYNMDELTSDISELVTSLGYKSCILVGHDWGGAISWVVAMKYPEIVSKLIVMNAPHPGMFQTYLSGHFTQFLKSWYFMFFQMPFLPELMLSNTDFEIFDRVFAGDEDSHEQKFTDEDIEAFKHNAARPGGLTAMINYYRCILKDPASTTLPPVTCPTLLLWGEEDRALEKGMIPYVEALVDDITVVRVPGASHWVQQDEPKICNRAMRAFLN